ncbi:transcription factor A, mitochondrial-like [Oratosquilla oratoria]|uniref:transcription factor A, mitochondrial-like n=1 Tax=Oratosquilla oratoria TaxID=337810 RepID=UPI003F76F72C
MAALGRLLRLSTPLVSRLSLLRVQDVPKQNGILAACKQTIAEELGIPEPPKRPLTPYMRFAHKTRENMKRQNPGLSHTEITSKLVTTWQNLPMTQKNYWSSEYQREKIMFDKRQADYIRSLTPLQIENIKELKRKRAKDKAKKQMRREKKKQSEELGKPKHPGNAFTMYLLSLDRGEAPLKEFLSGAASRWHRLPVQEQDLFKEKAKKLREQYEKELVKWEEKMIRAGRADLVRQHQQLEDLKSSASYRRITRD